jgi:hypothetical protein
VPHDPKKAFAVLQVIEIENILREVAESVEGQIASGSERFQKFQIAFDARFPVGSEDRSRAQAYAWALLESALAMLYSGQTTAVFGELHGLLELYAARDLAAILASDPKSRLIIKRLLSRKVLPELAEILEEIGVWNTEDVKFARKLSDIRNGVAHRNATLLSNRLANGRDLHHLDAMVLAAKVDCIPFVVRTVEMMLKLSRFRHSKQTEGD